MFRDRIQLNWISTIARPSHYLSPETKLSNHTGFFFFLCSLNLPVDFFFVIPFPFVTYSHNAKIKRPGVQVPYCFLIGIAIYVLLLIGKNESWNTPCNSSCNLRIVYLRRIAREPLWVNLPNPELISMLVALLLSPSDIAIGYISGRQKEWYQ